MRAMLLVNPKATTTNRRTRDVLIRALGAAVDLSVEETRYRGHAAMLASTARSKGFDLVVVLGGDGTINETVNGLLTPDTGEGGGSASRPAVAVIPGGSANVFARALGLPNDPVEATGAVLEALRDDRRRVVGLGHASWADESRYFTFCGGVGWDAEVIRAVEGLRGAGFRATPARYVATAVRQFFMTDRRHPAITVEAPGMPAASGIYLAIVSNTTPWTYVGSRPVQPTPWASFETGLDLLGLRRLTLPTMMGIMPQIFNPPAEGLPHGRHLVQLHDEPEITITATRPVAFQLDGDYLGEREKVAFRSIPDALQVMV
ncbi:diacylglycerol kinase family enzyme [Thermocatellispora tengchongensis]|uniref:Diacylglycerol kinase family enzyme n=1 Tax=Thermocatellispora tengchongensis TaxID=1073253 RepID=A0A840P4D4_9ACTN|nr:diacylglycerol kinase family protein [Thermocatellispora tengchongensis]MBB5132721.1 diacylglycerol kinase family enzyme [Thermocatellispora tengchongensis]